MGYFVAVLVGYFIGAKAGSDDLDQVLESLNALRQTDEFGDLVAALRSHTAHTLRELATMLDGQQGGAGKGHAVGEVVEMGDLVDRVRGMLGRN